MGTPPSRDDAARSAWQAMRTIVLELNDRRGEVSARLGMSFIRLKALGKLDRAPMTMRELAALLAVDAPYTTVVVDDLESRGLVERRPDPHDRRRKIVAITAAGRRLARRAGRILDEPPATLSALPAQDIAHLDRIMGVLLGNGGPDATAEPSADPH
ncbi:MarR family transcriptional regulator [Actinophytocola oryzae]|uniref:DNA-binding MarR family transcriptional regulator n=1 Tax=Actinophytocola oryzae TaxID=502181 RepID=A0A4R7W5G8_9PSEU|nr:helix-turn-helix domain-containing protein [Actinophytocola oryzae]TDV57348.1 DNA-binding MarR family transcriptional regulator [Actinophytocola oryzae]